MAENSKIEWTDHTFNPWSGCQKVSPGCQHCYAEAQAKRNPITLGIWGPQGTRVRMNEAYWRKPLKWNEQAWEQCVDCGWRGPHSETHDFCPSCDGENLRPARQRVFCASMADVFEDRDELLPWRRDLFDMIAETTNLDWLLLTKRPENIMPMLIQAGRGFQDLPPHIWIGTTVENQEQADRRIPELLNVPAVVRFLSCEPLLGPIDLEMIPDALYGKTWPDTTRGHGGIGGQMITTDPGGIHWVICGGESGHGARPAHPAWFRSLRDQCQAANVPFLFKQWGEWLDQDQMTDEQYQMVAELDPESIGGVADFKRPSYLFPSRDSLVYRIGKKAAGRRLDGVEWSQFPK